MGAIEDKDTNKQQKVLQGVLELDKYADSSSDVLLVGIVLCSLVTSIH